MAKTLEVLNKIAKGYVAKYGSWKFFMPDYLNELHIPELIGQAEINAELSYAEYLDAIDRSGNGNQTTGS